METNFFSQNLDDRTEMTPTCHTAPTPKPNNQLNPFNHNIFFFFSTIVLCAFIPVFFTKSIILIDTLVIRLLV